MLRPAKETCRQPCKCTSPDSNSTPASDCDATFQPSFKRLERHFDHVTNVYVTLKPGRQAQLAEATVHVSGRQLHADAAGSGMHAAIDALVDKLDRQIKRHKEKLCDHHRDEKGHKRYGG